MFLVQVVRARAAAGALGVAVRACLTGAVLGLVLAGCPDPGPEPEPEPTTVLDTTAAPESTASSSVPDEGSPGTVEIAQFGEPRLVGDLLVAAPTLTEPPEPGAVVHLPTEEREVLFDFDVIEGEFVPVASSWAIADDGAAALVYAAQQPDEGLTQGVLEIGALIRPADDGRLGEQVVAPLLTIDDPNSEAGTVHSLLIKVYATGDRLVVIDFMDSTAWLVEPDGSVTERSLSAPLAHEWCETYPCIDHADARGISSSGVAPIPVTRDRLVLYPTGQVLSGTVALMGIDLTDGTVTGPVGWRVPGSVLEPNGGVSCRGAEVCLNSRTAPDRTTDTLVMNTFNPVTLEIDYPAVPAGLTELSPYVFGDGLLWSAEGGSTVLTDASGTERWTLESHLRVKAESVATAGEGDTPGVVLAENSEGEVNRIDLETGESAGILDIESLDDVVVMNPRWVITQSGATLTAVPLD